MKDKLNYYNDYYKKINEIINILKLYFPDNKKILKNYETVKENISRNSLNNIIIKDDYDKLYEIIHEITILQNSKIFVEMYNLIRNNNDDLGNINDFNSNENVNNNDENINNSDENINNSGENINKNEENINNSDENINNSGENINKNEENINKNEENINNNDENINNNDENINSNDENINNSDENINNNDDFKNINLKLINKVKKEFYKLENLFYQYKLEEIDIIILEKVISNIHEDELNNEIKILMELFNINNNNLNNKDIFIEMHILKNRNKRIDIINKTILLLNDFNINNMQEINELNNINSNFKKCNTIQEMYNIELKLNELDLCILNSNNFTSQSVLYEMYSNPDLIKFLLERNIDDLKQMSEFIGDDENIAIDDSDLRELESCMAFVQKLKNENLKVAKIFLKNFVEVIEGNKNYKNIGINFKNASSKLKDFKELFKVHLNLNELNKVHINGIFDYSIFNINILYPDYECNILYNGYNKQIIKKFDEIQDLRDMALLKKYDKNDSSYYDICKKFVNIVDNIQEIIYLLIKIVSKGYYEEIYCPIEITKGNADVTFQENHYNLNETIKKLNNVIDIQNTEIISIYKSNSISRLIYGRQFFYIISNIK
ncbi:hypothetical protein BCR32DRAFT_299267 [Anaeromyces robustus]|uniref:Uncharacterized protein n=1 Tax=Anaeromyces robustus TaxID=1754192 RepID=A0A1Y1X8K9_9FUNG|nr:hypothetical protein BCR32DRAFT_299267 [Anaeromyces robustus]|eukprot:ORX81684.1 hypothetical protein BCR32DRAFT_299267 [Anaeromyces robustus]